MLLLLVRAAHSKDETIKDSKGSICFLCTAESLLEQLRMLDMDSSFSHSRNHPHPSFVVVKAPDGELFVVTEAENVSRIPKLRGGESRKHEKVRWTRAR